MKRLMLANNSIYKIILWRTCIFSSLYIGIMVRVFANGLVDWVQSLVEPYQRLKTWYLMPPCLTRHYKLQIKGK